MGAFARERVDEKTLKVAVDRSYIDDCCAGYAMQ